MKFDKYFFAGVSLLNAFSGTAAMIFIGRKVGVQFYGELVAAIAVVSLFFSTASMGIPHYLIHKGKAYCHEDNSLSAIYVAACSVLSVVAANIILHAENDSFLLWKFFLTFLILIQTLYDITISALQISNKFSEMAVATLLMNPLRLVAVFFLYLFDVKTLVFYVGALTIPSAFVFFMCNKEFSLSFRLMKSNELWVSVSKLKQMVYVSFPYAVDSLLYIAYFQITTIMLSANCGAKTVVKYSISYTLASSTYLFAVLYFQKLEQVKIINVMRSSKIDIRNSLIKNLSLALASGMTISLLIYTFGQKIISTLYGSAFVPDLLILCIVVLTVPLRFSITALTSYMLTPSYTKMKMYVIGAVLLLSATISYSLTKEYGAIGAASSIVLTELFWLLLLSAVFYCCVYQNIE